MQTPQQQRDAVEGGLWASLDEISGEVVQCPGRWSLLPVLDSANPFDEETVTCAPNANGRTHSFRFARRGCFVSRWLYEGADWMRRVDLGQAFGLNERIAENRGTGQEIEHNPTMPGAILKPDGSSQWKMYPSVPLHFRYQVQGAQATMEAAVAPMEFDSYGVEEPAHASKLGGPDTPGLWWRMRQFMRFEANVGGQADWHRLFFASYFPRSVNDTKTTMRSLLVASVWPIDYFGTGDADCIYYAPGEGREFSCLTGDANDWVGATPPNTRVNWNLTRASGLRGSVAPATDYNTGLLWNKRGHGAIILKSDSALFDMCVGFVCQSLREETGGGWHATELGASQVRTASVSPGYDANSGQRLSVRNASLIGRRRGWIGTQWWTYTGATVDEVKAAIDAAERRGLFDSAVPMSSIPAHVIAGTVPPAI